METIEVTSNLPDGLSATIYQATETVERVVIALHGAFMPAAVMCEALVLGNEAFLRDHKFAVICPEAKSLLRLGSGALPHYERSPLDTILPDTIRSIEHRWPNAHRYLAGHSYGGRGVILQGFHLGFRAYGVIAPFAESEPEFETMFRAIEATNTPIHLAFSQDDHVAWAAGQNSSRLLNLQNGDTKIVTNYHIPLFEFPHNSLILRQSTGMFYFFAQH